jgi:hypothetical protein
VAIVRRSVTGKNDVLLLEHDLGTKRRARAALAPEAVANRDALGLAAADVAHGTAYTLSRAFD